MNMTNTVNTTVLGPGADLEGVARGEWRRLGTRRQRSSAEGANAPRR